MHMASEASQHLMIQFMMISNLTSWHFPVGPHDRSMSRFNFYWTVLIVLYSIITDHWSLITITDHFSVVSGFRRSNQTPYYGIWWFSKLFRIPSCMNHESWIIGRNITWLNLTIWSDIYRWLMLILILIYDFDLIWIWLIDWLIDW